MQLQKRAARYAGAIVTTAVVQVGTAAIGLAIQVCMHRHSTTPAATMHTVPRAHTLRVLHVMCSAACIDHALPYCCVFDVQLCVSGISNCSADNMHMCAACMGAAACRCGLLAVVSGLRKFGDLFQ